MTKRYTANSTLGSAGWWNFQGLHDDDALHLLDSNLILGNSTVGRKGRIVFKPESNGLTVACTRGGKSNLIKANLSRYQGSILVLDPKGELASLTAKQRRKLGQKTVIFDPFGEVKKNYLDKIGDVELVTTFDLFSNGDSKTIKKKIRQAAESMIIRTKKASDDHWPDSGIDFTEGVLAWLYEDPSSELTLPNFRSIIAKPPLEIAKIAMRAQKELGEDSIAAKKLGKFAFTKIADNRELCSIISITHTQTAFLDDPEISTCLSSTTHGFSFDCLTEEGPGATIYLVLPFDKLDEHCRWLRTMASLAIDSVFLNTRKLDNPVLFILDEFGNIGPLPAISRAFSMGAARQMRLWAFVQDLSQIKRDYPEDWESIINNCEFLMFFNIMSEFTANYASKLLGIATVTIHNNSNTHYHSKPLLYPDEIRYLPADQGIIISSEGPMKFKKITHYNDPLFTDLLRKDPHYM